MEVRKICTQLSAAIGDQAKHERQLLLGLGLTIAAVFFEVAGFMVQLRSGRQRMA